MVETSIAERATPMVACDASFREPAMYAASDPRASLAPAARAVVPDRFAPAELGLFYADAPQEDDANGRTWYLRGQNLIVAHTEAAPGARLGRRGQVDEYALLVTGADTPVEVTAGGETVRRDGACVAFVPPGDGDVVLPRGGVITRFFTTRSGDLAARCPNAESFAPSQAGLRRNIPALEPWPAPPDGWRVRAYDLDVPAEAGRFGRIWRGTTFMLNVFEPQVGPRDVTKLSPHHHDDFEQCSLALEGRFVHHLRWPWTPDMTAWREDEHPHVRSPSAIVIPPPVIHTSRATDPGVNRLVDVFCPPRLDFSRQPGWVLNAGDYPMPTA